MRIENNCINKMVQDAQVEDNIPSQFIRSYVVSFINGITQHQRTPATHIHWYS